MTSKDWAIAIAAVSAVGSLAAAVAAWWTAKATLQANEAALFCSQYAEYGSPEMLRALRILRALLSDKGDNFEVKWKRELDLGDSRAHEVDQARRMVKLYFFRALRMYEDGFVSKRFLRAVAAVDGVNILYDIIEPLEQVLNPQYDRKRFRRLESICGRSRSGRLMAPVSVPPQSLANRAEDRG